MHRTFAILLLVLLISNVQAPPPSPLRARLGQINEYLENEVASDDALSNYFAANIYLETIANTGDIELIEALKLFIATKDLIDDVLCNSSSNFIAQKACDSIGSCSSAIVSKFDAPRSNRVSRIIIHSVQSHAKSCEFRYPKRYAALTINLDKNVADRTEEIGTSLGSLISRSSGYDDLGQAFNGDADRALKVVRSAYRLSFDKNLVTTLIGLISEPDFSYQSKLSSSHCDYNVPVDRVERLYDTLLVEPCHRYNTLLKTELFDLAEFDHVVRSENQLNDDYSMKFFYPGWLRYNICEQIIRSRHNWIESIKDQIRKKTC